MYSYSSLPLPSSIRLLRIHPGEGSLSCSIATADLSEAYDALSYTWGDPCPGQRAESQSCWETSSAHCILVDGHCLSITRNLHDALCRLRRLKIYGPLWIDRICIDQQDIDERGAQVAIMADIYTSAQQVLIWLGEEDPDTLSAASLISTLAAALNLKDFERATTFHMNDLALYEYLEHPLVETHQWQCISRLFRRSWFQRGWVIQEFALANRRTVLCGSVQIDCIALCEIATFLDKSGRLRNPVWQLSHFSHEASVGVVCLRLMCSCAIDAQDGGLEHPNLQSILIKEHGPLTSSQMVYTYLADILSQTGTFCFTDDRDYVLAAMSFVKALTPSNELHLDWIVPNYRIPSSQLYIDVSQLILQNTNSLSILRLASYSGDALRIPSWVPNWSTCITRLPGKCDATKNWSTPLYKNPPCSDLLSSVKGSDNFIEQQGCYGELLVTIKVLGSIEYETNAFHGGIGSGTRFMSTWWDIIVQIPEISVATGQNRVEVLWRTLTAGIPDDDNTRTLDFSNTFREVVKYAYAEAIARIFLVMDEESLFIHRKFQTSYKKLLQVSSSTLLPTQIEIETLATRMIELSISGQQSYLQESLLNHGLWKHGSQFLNRINGVCVEKRLIRTRTDMLGLAPATSEIGDLVCFLRGSRVPFILRKDLADDRYKLIGEVYLHGLMNGEIEGYKLDAKDGFLV